MHFVTENPLNPLQLFEKLDRRDSGSMTFHYAVVKSQNGDKTTSGILFKRDGDMEAEMSEIENDIRKRWTINDILLVRRMGLLKVGDLISLVAVSADSSKDTFEACRYALERIRKMASLKKNELYLDE